MNVRVKFECIEGGHGWGEVGNLTAIVIKGEDNWVDVVREAFCLMPGGWRIITMVLVQ